MSQSLVCTTSPACTTVTSPAPPNTRTLAGSGSGTSARHSRVKSGGPRSTGGGSTIKFAQRDAEPQPPMTSTQYRPASRTVTCPRIKELLVAPGIIWPFLLQTKANGAVPVGTALKLTSAPGQTV